MVRLGGKEIVELLVITSGRGLSFPDPKQVWDTLGSSALGRASRHCRLLAEAEVRNGDDD